MTQLDNKNPIDSIVLVHHPCLKFLILCRISLVLYRIRFHNFLTLDNDSTIDDSAFRDRYHFQPNHFNRKIYSEDNLFIESSSNIDHDKFKKEDEKRTQITNSFQIECSSDLKFEERMSNKHEAIINPPTLTSGKDT